MIHLSRRGDKWLMGLCFSLACPEVIPLVVGPLPNFPLKKLSTHSQSILVGLTHPLASATQP